MRKSSYECKHKWRRVNRDLEECVRCHSRQMIMAFEVESVPKQRKTLQPNEIIPMLHDN